MSQVYTRVQPLSPSVMSLFLGLVLLLGCVRCGGGSQSARDNSTAASPPESRDSSSAQHSTDSSKEPTAEERPANCRDVGSSTSICADDKNVAAVEGASGESR